MQLHAALDARLLVRALGGIHAGSRSSTLLVWMRVPGDIDLQHRRAAVRLVRGAAVDTSQARPDIRTWSAARGDLSQRTRWSSSILRSKLAHIAAVSASGGLFFLRGAAAQLGAQWTMAAPLRYLSYTIDTVLLTAAFMLVTILHQYPFVQAWLTVKVLLLVAYIVPGSYALKRGHTPPFVRLATWLGALAIFGFIVSVARTHDPLGALRLLGRPDAELHRHGKRFNRCTSAAPLATRFALFDYGFRPFFLVAGLYAFLVVPIWLYFLHTVRCRSAPCRRCTGTRMSCSCGFVVGRNLGIHAHGGTQLTGARGFCRPTVDRLVGIWVAGRVAMATVGHAPFFITALVELSFLPALMLLLIPPLLRSQNRNTPLLIVLGVLWVSDLGFVLALLSGDIALAECTVRAGHRHRIAAGDGDRRQNRASVYDERTTHIHAGAARRCRS